LLPAALVLLVVGLWLTRRAARTDLVRASLIAWGGWLFVTGLTFSLMEGIFHEYYTVALAPAIGALVGIGSWLLWRRGDLAGRAALAGVVVLSAVWAAVLLGRAADWNPWLAPLVVAGGLGAAVALVATALPDEWTGGLGLRRGSAGGGVLAAAVQLVAPAAWSEAFRAGRAVVRPSDLRRAWCREAAKADRVAGQAVPWAACWVAPRSATSSPPCWPRTPTSTRGSPPPPARRTPPATSWPPSSR
jgi:hypothetical protein